MSNVSRTALTGCTAAGSGATSPAKSTTKSTPADDSITEMIVQVKGVIGNPSADTAKLKAAVTAVQTEFTAIGKLCS